MANARSAPVADADAIERERRRAIVHDAALVCIRLGADPRGLAHLLTDAERVRFAGIISMENHRVRRRRHRHRPL